MAASTETREERSGRAQETLVPEPNVGSSREELLNMTEGSERKEEMFERGLHDGWGAAKRREGKGTFQARGKGWSSTECVLEDRQCSEQTGSRAG